MADLKVVTKTKVSKGKKPKRTLKADTVIHLIVDASGSMSGLTSATLEGINSYISKQREEEGDVLVSMTMFDSDYMRDHALRLQTPFVATKLEDIPEITGEHYRADGGTPLRDAVVAGIRATDEVLARVKTKNPDVLVVIVTDGGENTSEQNTARDVKALVESREGQGWTFTYMGANQDSWAETQNLGFNVGNVMNYSANDIKAGAFDKMAASTTVYRARSRDLKAKGLVAEAYTTTSFYADAGVTEDQPVTSESENSTKA